MHLFEYSVKNVAILVIVGAQNPEKISHQMIYTFVHLIQKSL